jgi:hypothetical protein
MTSSKVWTSCFPSAFACVRAGATRGHCGSSEVRQTGGATTYCEGNIASGGLDSSHLGNLTNFRGLEFNHLHLSREGVGPVSPFAVACVRAGGATGHCGSSEAIETFRCRGVTVRLEFELAAGRTVQKRGPSRCQDPTLVCQGMSFRKFMSIKGCRSAAGGEPARTRS